MGDKTGLSFMIDQGFCGFFENLQYDLSKLCFGPAKVEIEEEILPPPKCCNKTCCYACCLSCFTCCIYNGLEYAEDEQACYSCGFGEYDKNDDDYVKAKRKFDEDHSSSSESSLDDY